MISPHQSRSRTIDSLLLDAVAMTQRLTGTASGRIDLASPSYRDEITRGLVELGEFLEARGADRGSLTVLDLGVGKGWSANVLAHDHRRVLACDLAHTVSEQLALNAVAQWQVPFWREYLVNRTNLAYAYFDGFNIPAANRSVDLVVAIAVLEHVGGDTLDDGPRRRWLAEVNRVLKPGGVLYLSECPHRHSYAEALAGWLGLPHHVKRFDRRELARLLGEAGLQVKTIAYSHPWIDFYPSVLGRIWSGLYRYGFRWLTPLVARTPLRHLFHHHRVIAVKG